MKKNIRKKSNSSNVNEENSESLQINLLESQKVIHTYICTNVQSDNRKHWVKLKKSSTNIVNTISTLVKDSHNGIKANQRLDIYREMYIARLIEVLEIDFPLLKALLKNDFESIMMKYIELYPSKNNSLNFYGQSIPKFFKKFKKEYSKSKIAHKFDLKLLQEVAEFEWKIAEMSFLAKQEVLFTSEMFSQIAQEKWENLKFTPTSYLQLFKFDYPINTLLNKVVNSKKQKRGFTKNIQKEKSYLALNLLDNEVWRYKLSRDEFDLLKLLVSDYSLSQAIEKWLEKDTKRRTKLAETALQNWFARWLQEGFFVDIN